MEERALRVLILEDAPADADLCQRELRRAAIRFAGKRVDTREAFEQALEASPPDLILSDFTMPAGFDGLAALDLARAKSADIPFIFVSGTLGEERAVEAMRRGATDYVLKDKLNRLVPVVERALRESEERAARRKTERELEETRSRLGQHSVVPARCRVVVFTAGAAPALCEPGGRHGVWPAGRRFRRGTRRMDAPAASRRSRARAARTARVARNAPLGFDLPRRASGGEVRWIHDRGSVIQDDEGELLRIDGLAATSLR
jgi:CheY-like chemotaxis protein